MWLQRCVWVLIPTSFESWDRYVNKGDSESQWVWGLFRRAFIVCLHLAVSITWKLPLECNKSFTLKTNSILFYSKFIGVFQTPQKIIFCYVMQTCQTRIFSPLQSILKASLYLPLQHLHFFTQIIDLFTLQTLRQKQYCVSSSNKTP